MREIKFRAWDKEDKQMLKTVTGMHVAVCFENPKRFELMQYTGLRDKNGKEIYEGDVVQYEVDDECIEKGYIVYDIDKCIFELHYGVELWRAANCKDFQVIGNIYENPELVKFK